ncbi:MAG: hypothetical protein KTR32_17085 [Granulosicoccus sp.]|nr:hypothetical protein [Granulosicoccus sp.]
MKAGTLLAVLAITAYLGFEAYAIKKASHRTKPSYIYNVLAESHAAARLCQFGDETLRRKFDSTMARVKIQFNDDLLEQLSAEDANRRIAEVTEKASARVQSLAESDDCSSQVMKDYFQRFRIYARRS